MLSVTVLQLILSILDEVERLDGENCYYCERCQQLVTAERRLCYELLPNILTIHLKRFAMHSRSCIYFMQLFICSVFKIVCCIKHIVVLPSQLCMHNMKKLVLVKSRVALLVGCSQCVYLR